MKWLVNGREAYTYTGGKAFDPTLPCVVFIHGALHDHTVWTLLARWCAHHGFGVLAVDLPGHMKSAGPALESVEAMAEWVLALLDAAEVKQAALVGHSMGSLVALEAAGRAPDRVSKLVMIGTAYPMKVSPALLEMSKNDPLAAIDLVTTLSYSSIAQKPGYPGPGVWVRGGGKALGRMVLAKQGNALLYHQDFVACNGYAGALDAAAKVTAPATLICGRRDQMTPPKAAAEIGTALKARLETVDAGHVLMAEAPDEVLNALRKALV
ncbi:MAG TPA: alpha/beta hydrolase [Ideonella sp.]|uniref:alpha/beta fold hydrolase n=1 Tax=Ideonella sp. TaxID=1929293 RepID=UPI002E2F8B4E|nr:alpha/beta hydrolase [Ideonella sp.]HEX5685989.1 alpha/beta hydrolase [Ideonella sp.]